MRLTDKQLSNILRKHRQVAREIAKAEKFDHSEAERTIASKWNLLILP